MNTYHIIIKWNPMAQVYTDVYNIRNKINQYWHDCGGIVEHDRWPNFYEYVGNNDTATEFLLTFVNDIANIELVKI